MPNRWGNPTEDEKWAAEMQRRKRRARILLIRRVAVCVVALVAIGSTLMWLLDVFNRQFGNCFDRYGELTFHQEHCLTYSPQVWLFAVGSIVVGLLIILFIVSLIAAPASRARSTCSCKDICKHEQAQQNAMAMGIVFGMIFGSNNN